MVHLYSLEEKKIYLIVAKERNPRHHANTNKIELE